MHRLFLSSPHLLCARADSVVTAEVTPAGFLTAAAWTMFGSLCTLQHAVHDIITAHLLSVATYPSV